MVFIISGKKSICNQPCMFQLLGPLWYIPAALASSPKYKLYIMTMTLFSSKSTNKYVLATIFPVVMSGCESWTIKNAEHWRIDAFKLWCWRTLLRILWTARRSSQSILKEISPEYSLEGLMLKLQYFSHLMQRPYSLEKTLTLGRIEGERRRWWLRMRWLDGITHTNSMDEFEQTLGDREGQGSLCAAVHQVAKIRHDLATEQQQLPYCKYSHTGG